MIFDKLINGWNRSDIFLRPDGSDTLKTVLAYFDICQTLNLMCINYYCIFLQSAIIFWQIRHFLNFLLIFERKLSLALFLIIMTIISRLCCELRVSPLFCNCKNIEIYQNAPFNVHWSTFHALILFFNLSIETMIFGRFDSCIQTYISV